MKQSVLKKFIAASLAAAMAVSVTACGNTGGSSSTGGSAAGSTASKAATAEGDKEITFWDIATENPDKEIMEYAVKKFNEMNKDGYHVTMVPTQNDNYKEKLVVAMSSGECPDMYTSWSGGPMNEYIDSGYAQPIDDLMKSSGVQDKLMEAAVAQATYNGHIYAVPMLNVSMAGVFYNKEMFQKYNIKVPTTLSELEKAADTLKSNGITPFALANSSKWTGSMYFQCLAARKAGLDPFRNAVAGKGSFEDECFTYAGDKIQEWTKKGYFPDGVNSLSEDDGQARQLLYQEKAGMDLIGSWYTGNIKTDSADFYKKVGWFSFPKIDGSTADDTIQIGTVGDQFISFNCKGDKLKAAFECAKLYSSDEAVDLMIKNGKIPPIKGVDSKLSDPLTKQICEAANKASSVQLWYDQYLPPAVAETHLNTCQEMFGLTMTPKDAAAKMQKSMKDYLANKSSSSASKK